MARLSKRARAVFDAISAADVAAVERLLGAEAGTRATRNGLTMVGAAIFESLDEARYGSSPDPDRQRAFFEIAARLLEHGADVDLATTRPRTSTLQLALGDARWVRWLLERRANPDLYDSDDRRAAPRALADAVARGATVQLELLLAAGAELNRSFRVSSGSGWPLELAVARRGVDDGSRAAMLDVLLRSGRCSAQHLARGLIAALMRGDEASAQQVIGGGAVLVADDPAHTGPLTVILARAGDARIELLERLLPPSVLEAARARTRPPRASLGVAGFLAPADEAEHRATAGAAAGAGVQTVIDGSAAARAGLRRGDVITTLDGTPIARFAELLEALRSHAPGDQVALGYFRDGEESSVTVTLDAR